MAAGRSSQVNIKNSGFEDLPAFLGRLFGNIAIGPMVISLLFSLYDLKTRVPYSCDGLSKWQNITFSVKEFYFHVSGHNSPLFGRREEDEVEHPGHNFNVNDTIAWWLSQVSPQKELQHFPHSREPRLRSWPLVCPHLGMAGSSWMKMRCRVDILNEKDQESVISSEWSVLPDCSQQPQRAVHWPIGLPWLLRDFTGS